jgi:hypothetical protein
MCTFTPMRLVKSIISLLLLLTYSVGFAHDLVPHCHVNKTTNWTFKNPTKKDHHLAHHKHTRAVDLDENTIVHENHLDDSLFDFVVCILSEIEHHEDFIHHHFIPGTTDHSLEKKLNNPSLTHIIFVSGLEFSPKESTIPSDTFSAHYTEASFVASSPHRGPPTLSC